MSISLALATEKSLIKPSRLLIKSHEALQNVNMGLMDGRRGGKGRDSIGQLAAACHAARQAGRWRGDTVHGCQRTQTVAVH